MASAPSGCGPRDDAIGLPARQVPRLHVEARRRLLLEVDDLLAPARRSPSVRGSSGGRASGRGHGTAAAATTGNRPASPVRSSSAGLNSTSSRCRSKTARPIGRCAKVLVRVCVKSRNCTFGLHQRVDRESHRSSARHPPGERRRRTSWHAPARTRCRSSPVQLHQAGQAAMRSPARVQAASWPAQDSAELAQMMSPGPFSSQIGSGRMRHRPAQQTQFFLHRAQGERISEADHALGVRIAQRDPRQTAAPFGQQAHRTLAIGPASRSGQCGHRFPGWRACVRSAGKRGARKAISRCQGVPRNGAAASSARAARRCVDQGLAVEDEQRGRGIRSREDRVLRSGRAARDQREKDDGGQGCRQGRQQQGQSQRPVESSCQLIPVRL